MFPAGAAECAIQLLVGAATFACVIRISRPGLLAQLNRIIIPQAETISTLIRLAALDRLAGVSSYL